MAWWQAAVPVSKDWNWDGSFLRDTLARAATSVQRLAEQAELELNQTKDDLRARAVVLAEQAETSLRASADLVVDNISALGLLPSGDEKASLSEEELCRRFEAEARALGSAAKSAAAKSAAAEAASRPQPEAATFGLLRAAAEATVAWENRFVGVGRRGTSTASMARALPLEAAPLRALLRSRALDRALSALAQSPEGREILRAAAGAGSLRRSDGGDNEEGDLAVFGVDVAREEDDDELTVERVGKRLWKVLARASAVPLPLMAQLVTLLVDVAAADTQAAADPDSAAHALPDCEGIVDADCMVDGLGRDAAWVLSLLAAALCDASEAALHGRSALREAVERAFATSSLLAEALAHGSPAEDDWVRQLDVAEAQCRSFREFRGLFAELSACLPVDEGSLAAYVTDGASEVLDVAVGPLAGRAEALAALRAEGESQCEGLGSAAAKCDKAGEDVEEQLSMSSRGFEIEMAALRAQQQEQTTQIVDLSREREELLAKLQALDTQLASLTAARSEAALRESQVAASAARVAEQLQQDMSTGEAARCLVAQRQQRLLQAAGASRGVEAQLARRAEELAVRAKKAAERGPRRKASVAAACLEAERARGRHFEDLISSWHAAIWGPGADMLVRDTERLAIVRGLHMRAGALVEQAWRELGQLDVAMLGDGGALGFDPEDVSAAAARYRGMRPQLQANLERLTRLEAALEESPTTAAGGDPLRRPPFGADGMPTARLPPAAARASALAHGHYRSSSSSSDSSGKAPPPPCPSWPLPVQVPLAAGGASAEGGI